MQVIEIEKNLNCHAISWVEIFNTRLDHGHVERIMSSKVTKSENKADMYVLLKDNKGQPWNTRPVGRNDNEEGQE